jgi:Leucine-rich repeat (LRR) protein
MLSYLKELFSSNPFVTSIDFSARNVTVLDPSSLALLSRFTELRRLDLSDNLIRALPPDLSSLSLLLEFDLNGNPLDDLELAVDALRTLPNLKSLRINLHEED